MARLYDLRRWRRESKQFLEENPFCIDCTNRGITTSATVVDHDIPHKEDAELFFDRANWRARCKPCHDAKTAGRDGGFGNAIRKQHTVPGTRLDGTPTDKKHHWNTR